MDAIKDLLNKMGGFDQTNEFFKLWYEVTYLRLLINQILVLNPSLQEKVTPEQVEQCRIGAQDVVRGLFPNMNITFPDKKKATE